MIKLNNWYLIFVGGVLVNGVDRDGWEVQSQPIKEWEGNVVSDRDFKYKLETPYEPWLRTFKPTPNKGVSYKNTTDTYLELLKMNKNVTLENEILTVNF